MVLVQYIITLIGITRATDMIGHPESLADILMHANAAGFLLDLHGKEHTDEIGVQTVLCSLQRTPYRDACQAPPCPVVPHHVSERPSSARGRRRCGDRAGQLERVSLADRTAAAWVEGEARPAIASPAR